MLEFQGRSEETYPGKFDPILSRLPDGIPNSLGGAPFQKNARKGASINETNLKRKDRSEGGERAARDEGGSRDTATE